MTKEQAQENLRTVLLGGKQADNTRPINKNIDLGKNGYFFVLDDRGNLLAHPSLEVQSIWDKKTSDGTYYIQNMVKAAQQGGGITYYNWPLPNSKKEALKVTYAEKAPSWEWIIAAGSYMQDYNGGQRNILSTTLITLAVCLAGCITLLTLFANYLTTPIVRIANQAEQMAKGDLTGELIMVSSDDEVGQLAKSINTMVISLRTTINGILLSEESVSAAAQQISATTQEVASGSTSQANDAQAMSQLFKELSAAINSVAVSAGQAAELSNSTLDIAQNGEIVVRASIAGHE
jgi:methyl-accepting chemotaxis protein